MSGKPESGFAGAASRFGSTLLRLPGNGYFWLFAAALLLRLIYLAQAWRGNELLVYPVVDAQVYVKWAQDILAGNGLWLEPINYTPGYPLWLAGWIALLGWNPPAHFAIFHLFGALQAVLIGRTAELLWNRRVGLAAGWLAATYWPLIIFEASHFAEPFAILNLTVVLFLIVRWSRQGGALRPLVWAGFCLGWSILARANAMLCAPALAGWAALVAAQKHPKGRLPRAVAALLALALPAALLCSPVLFWNWKLMGRPILRTDGPLSIYAGNEPDFRALAVPVGVRWTDLVYRPVRAGITEANGKEAFWREQTLRVMRERPGEWVKLMARKAIMLTGRFEISQEIDIGIFRRGSPVLSAPIWPGWGTVAPLAALCALAMWRSPGARRGWPLLLCAGIYFASITPVQAAARYRLPVLVPLLPLAGWALIAVADALRRRDAKVIVASFAVLAASGLAVDVDWLNLRQEKIVNHWFLLGLKRAERGDLAGAQTAYEAGVASNPADADCSLRLGQIWLLRGDLSRAEEYFTLSRTNFPPGHEALLGLGDCALAAKKPDEALARTAEALKIAPNNLDALSLASRAFIAQEKWGAVAAVSAEMRSYQTFPAAIAFTEAWAWTLAGRPAQALPLYEMVATTARFSPLDRARGAFLAGALAWRLTGDAAKARSHWQQALHGPPTFFRPLAGMLTGATTTDAALATLPQPLEGRSKLYVEAALALRASIEGQPADARRHYESLAAVRDARRLPPAERDVLEIWALAEIPPPP